METLSDARAGRLAAIWRYPVKSMLGEELSAVDVAESGLLGDRSFALIDDETGKVISAKNPRRWPDMFHLRSACRESAKSPDGHTEAEITLPGGEVLGTDDANLESRLSAVLGRSVRLSRLAVGELSAEGYWPAQDWLNEPDTSFEFPLPSGTFFDGAPIHLVTTATLRRLSELEPQSRFDVRRFRPNLVIEPAPGDDGFVENGWIGRTLAVGDVEFRIDGPCPRCIMTMLAQGDLPRDPNVLRTAVQWNSANVGVYASVLRGGRVQVDDPVRLS